MKQPPTLDANPFAPVQVIEAGNLSGADKAFLQKEEAIIERGIRTFLDVATALARIRDYGDGVLYSQFGSFEAYCRERWEFGPSYTHRLLDAARVVEILPMGKKDAQPTNERQIRALCLLAEPKDQCQAWKQAIKAAGESPVTGRIVQTAVRKMIDAGAERKTAERKASTKQAPKEATPGGKVLTAQAGEAALKTKSIHSPIEVGDGLRILASRFRGRDITRDRCDVWMPNLGPSEPLLEKWKAGQIEWPDYIEEYKHELLLSEAIDAGNKSIKNHGQKFTLRLIKELARRQTVTLLCQCAEEEQHCHRHVLQKLILSNTI